MKTLKTLLVFGLVIIFLQSCKEKSNDNVLNKNNSSSVKPSEEYAIMLVISSLKVARIYYGNNKTEDYKFSEKTSEEGLISLLNTNDVVDALNYMDKNGWELKNTYSIGTDNGTQEFIFRKVK